MKFKIRLHPAGQDTVLCENITAGYWYETLPGKGGSIKTCGEDRATPFRAEEVLNAFANEETYTLECLTKQEIHAKRIGTTKLFRVLDPNSNKWLGRVDPNEPLHWVANRHEAVSINKKSVEQRFPENLIALIWL